MSKAWSDFMAKARPANPFQSISSSSSNNSSSSTIASSIDIERQNRVDAAAATAGQGQGGVKGMLQGARNFVLGRAEPEPQGWLSIFNFLPYHRNYTASVICLGVAAFFIVMDVFLAPEIVIVPAKFAMCFTFAMISLIAAMAFLSGPRLYIKKLFMAKNLWATILLIASILGALWFSVI